MERLWNLGLEAFQFRWRRFMWLGFVSIVLGAFAIGASVAATLFTTYLLGCLLLAGGAVHLVECFSFRGWSGFFGHLLWAILYGLAGAYLTVRPGAGALSLTFLIGGALIAGGVFRLVSSVAARHPGWGWSSFSGVLSAALGSMIFFQWPTSALWVVGALVGVDLIMNGLLAVMLGLAVRSSLRAIPPSVGARREEREPQHSIR